MSKYDKLWIYIKNQTISPVKLSFEKISEIAGTPLDHFFLNFKKELKEYGWYVVKISIKEQTVVFDKVVYK